MQPDAYQTLRNWYLAKLRKAAIDAADEMTPSILMAADRKTIDRMVAFRGDSQSASGNKHMLMPLLSVGSFGLFKVDELQESIAQLQNRITELVERENAIADFSRDLICSIDSSKTIVAVNPAVQVQIGHPPPALIGQSLDAIVCRQDLPRLERALEEAKSETSGSKAELQIELLNGTRKDFFWSFEWSESNSIFFCCARDITAEKDLQRVKNEFVAMVSHDLRTPLMSIQLTLGLLNRFALDKLTTEHAEQVKAAETSVRSLISLINDLLDVEKMESGKLQLNFEELMIQDILERALLHVRELAAARSIKLEYTPTELEFKADASRLEQVMVNLISNAIKFSPEGGRVHIAASASGKAVEIVVSDEGSGIPEESRARIFDRFHQMKAEDGRQGAGLGLTICKMIVESHDGQIGVRSSPEGKGSEFWFKVPYRK